MSTRLAAVSLAVCLCVLTSCSAPVPDVQGASHVVFISIDTARADHFGFMGNEAVRTPRLDALAAESIVFTDYMTVVPTTLASHTSLMTGKYPLHHGTPRNGFIINEKNEMLAEILGSAGFHTAGFAGSFALDSRFGFAQGFDHYDEDWQILVSIGGAEQNERRGEHVTAAVVDYLDTIDLPEHLFLFAHFFDPHAPYTAPAPFDTMYDPEGWADMPRMSAIRHHSSMPESVREEYARRLKLHYASEISYVDDQVGRLLDELDARGILDDAIVVLTSDHGECMWEHGEEFDHGRTVYQATMHTPCVVRLPGARLGGTRVDGIVASVDVLPTVLDFLGLDSPNGLDGEAIALDLAALESPLEPRIRFGEATKPERDVETDPRWQNLKKARCVRDGDHKYIETPYLWMAELYDLEYDPREIDDLLSAEGSGDDEGGTPAAHRLSRGELESLHERLEAELTAWTETAEPLPSHFDSSQIDETIRRLRSLGYLQ